MKKTGTVSRRRVLKPKNVTDKSLRPTLEVEDEWRQRGSLIIAGVDEAGRGPLAGPVSVGAVVLPEGFTHACLHDSKKLTAKKREEIYEELTCRSDIAWQVVLVDVAEIEQLNILHATYAGMRRAVLQLAPEPEVALIDGLPVPHFPIPQQALVKGDSRSLSIAAASVLAKVTRDRYMLRAAEEYPHYGFHLHKGYGTAAHLEALRRHGPCPLHRRAFAPVAQLCFTLEGG